jgi:2-keto-4-pentenoate hydratase/2-oxohepta-3-ene-1,7-dioic acid hydratase in catechol pathway
VKFARLGLVGAERPVLLADGHSYDLSGVTQDITGAFLANGGPQQAAAALTAGHLTEIPNAAALRVGAPIARPGVVVCVGLNYAAHAAESNAASPEHPVIFFKPPNTVVGPQDEVAIPRNSLKTDWEVELGVVIRRVTSYLDSAEQSLEHIAGYVLADDISERTFQLELSGGQWSKGKSAPGFTPTGPWLVTPDEVDPADLVLRSWVNGEPRQGSSTADMIFDVPYLVWHLSQFMTLEPGDLLLTGTPEGVAVSGRFPYLREGDVVELEGAGLGRQRTPFGSATRAGAPV